MDIITIKEDYKDLFKKIQSTEIIPLDIETDDLNPFTCKIRSIQLKLDEDIYIIDCKYFKEIEKIAELLIHKKCIGHNIKFDAKVLLAKTGYNLLNVWDTMVAETVLHMGIGSLYYSLEDLVEKYIGEKLDKSVREQFYQIDFDKELTQEQIIYSALDVKYLEDIMNFQLNTDKKLTKTLRLEMKLVPVVTAMEMEGIEINTEKLLALAARVREEGKQLTEKLLDLLVDRLDFSKYNNMLELADGLKLRVTTKRDREPLKYVTDLTTYKNYVKQKFNPSSPSQLKNVLNLIGIPVDSTREETLKSYNRTNKDSIIEIIIDLREKKKRETSYGENILERIDPSTGRIHAEFNQNGTVTGRFSSNMHQWPREKEYRECIVAGDGYKFLVPDYSQQEYRLAGSVSKEPQIIKAYRENKDLHRLSASFVFDKPFNDVTDEERQIGKTFNFAALYGSSEYGLAYNLGMDVEDARVKLERFYKGYPVLSAFKDIAEKLILARMYSVTLLGRKRFFKTKGFYADDREYWREVNSIKREGFNHIIQGTGADILKIGMCLVYYENPFGNPARPLESRLKIVNCTHDEQTIKVTEDIAEEASKFVREKMIEAEERFLNGIDAVVDIKISDTWTK